MNRPDENDFWVRGGFRLKDYNDCLEEYCDELEKQIEDGYPQHLSELCDIKDKRISKLEKALDKACQLLDDNDIPYANKDGIEIRGVNNEQWKEYLLKNEC